jgi:hypothetical protein
MRLPVSGVAAAPTSVELHGTDRSDAAIRYQTKTKEGENEMSNNANVIQTSGTRTGLLADRKLLRLSATLPLIGFVLLSVLTQFVHPGGSATLEATFADNAASGAWTAIHLGQFVGMAVLLAGLLVLFFARSTSRREHRVWWVSSVPFPQE